MPELSPKPPDARSGFGITAEWLNQLKNAIPRTITGGDGASVKRMGDRYVIEQQQFPENEQISEVHTFVVLIEYDDVLACVSAISMPLPFYHDPNLGWNLLANGENGGVIYVAKPRWLRRTFYERSLSAIPVHANTSVGFTHVETGKRISRTVIESIGQDALPYFGPSHIEVITPSYFSGEVIRAVRSDSGLFIIEQDRSTQTPVTWIDINDAGRSWQRADHSFPVKPTTYAGDGYWNGVLAVRDNSAHVYIEQTDRPIWILGTSTDLDLDSPIQDVMLKGEFIGVETGGSWYMMVDVSANNKPLTDTEVWLALFDGYDPAVTPDNWIAGTYDAGHVVRHNGSSWVSLVVTSEEPGDNNSEWLQVVVANKDGTFSLYEVFYRGDVLREARATYQIDLPSTGLSGITSINDSTTADQTIGIGLVTGGVGGVNITTTAAAWSSTQSYRSGWIVSRLGVTYRCILANLNQQPPNATYWVATTGDGHTIVNVPWANYNTGLVSSEDYQSFIGIKHFYSGILIGDKNDGNEGSGRSLQINNLIDGNQDHNYGIILFGDPDSDFGSTGSGAVISSNGQEFDLTLYRKTAFGSATANTETNLDFRASIYNGSYTQNARLTIGGLGGTGSDPAPAFAVRDSTGSDQVGAWATVSGLSFKGGLYITGSLSITSVGTITTGVWQGTAIAAAFGGTGQTGFAVGDILYSDTTTTLARLAIGTTRQMLTVISGIPSWVSPSGAWVPTLTDITNTSSRTAYTCQYTRIGDVVTFSGKFDVTPSGAGATSFRMTLPVASNFAFENNAGGVAAAGQVAGLSARIYADVTNDELIIEWVAVDTSSRSWSFSGSYRVI